MTKPEDKREKEEKDDDKYWCQKCHDTGVIEENCQGHIATINCYMCGGTGKGRDPKPV